jgi:NRAMP (natural resistance-associated macrophage protein)-like metal ion transporter
VPTRHDRPDRAGHEPDHGRPPAPTIPHQPPVDDRHTIEAALEHERNPLKRLFLILGPGLVTGASDDDPSGIGTYASAGAALGYATLWTAVVTLPMMAAVQFICAKIGMVTGMGLAGVLRRHYPRWLLYPAVLLVTVANTLNAGADIGAIAAGINLVAGVPIAMMIVPVTLAILALQIWGSYRLIARTFKWLTLALLAYVGAGVLSQPDWGQVLRHTFVPTLVADGRHLAMLVALLGTTISPYLFFWQASQEVEEEISMGRTRLWQRRGATKKELHFAWLDVTTGMAFCNVIFFFIILTSAATLHRGGPAVIESAAQAAEALRPIAGDAARFLFAAGLIGAGFLAVPVLTGSAAYAVSEAFGWKYGLNSRPEHARQFYAMIALSTLAGMLLNFVGVDTIDALFWTAVINGFVAPPLLVLIMLMASSPRVMGTWTNGRWLNVVGWATVAAMVAAAVGLVVTWRS